MTHERLCIRAFDLSGQMQSANSLHSGGETQRCSSLLFTEMYNAYSGSMDRQTRICSEWSRRDRVFDCTCDPEPQRIKLRIRRS